MIRKNYGTYRVLPVPEDAGRKLNDASLPLDQQKGEESGSRDQIGARSPAPRSNPDAREKVEM